MKLSFEPKKIGEFEPQSPEWLELRNKGIGGSDAGVIMRLNPYKSLHQLWAEKAGIAPKIPFEGANTAATSRGNLYEPYVVEIAKKALEQEGKKVDVTIDKATYQSGDRYLEFLHANVDAILTVDGKKALLECKTLTAQAYDTIARWKSGIVPASYDAQCRHYMAVMDIDVCYICCCWGLDAADYALIKLERDEGFEEAYLAECEKFWECVTQKTEPKVDDELPEALASYHLHMHGEAKKGLNKVNIPITAIKTVENHIFDMEKLSNEIAQVSSTLKDLQKRYDTSVANCIELLEIKNFTDTIDISAGDARAIISVKDKKARDKIEEERVKEVAPELIERGMKFDGGTLKKSLQEELKKTVCSKERKEQIKKTLEEITTKGETKGEREYSVKFY